MKKILLVMSVAMIMALCSAPSLVSAYVECGEGMFTGLNNYRGIETIYSNDNDPDSIYRYGSTYFIYCLVGNTGYPLYRIYDDQYTYVSIKNCQILYIPTLDSNQTITYEGYTINAYNNYDEYIAALPEELRPVEPTWTQKLWLDFIDFLEFQLGLEPFDGGIWNFFKRYFDDPENETLDITFPTNAPTPTPTPRPTPIPVQTIYVPDGNGSYTIVYQYPDPSGTITQSPYNPNIDVNVEVDCDCDGGSQNYNPQDPMYAPFEGLSWSSPDGDLTGSPAMSASQSLDAIKTEVDSYDEPIKVVSNSFGALPGKWLSLVGLLGACLIVAGLIKTFLGG